MSSKSDQEKPVDNNGCCGGRTFDIMTILFGYIHSFGVKINQDLVVQI